VETLALLLRASNVMPQGFVTRKGSEWFDPYLSVAKANHLISEDFSPSDSMNRANVSALIIHTMALNPDPQISRYIAQVDPQSQRFTPNEIFYTPIIQTGNLFPDTTRTCSERSPKINPCLAYDTHPTGYTDIPAYGSATKAINLLRNTVLMATGERIFRSDLAQFQPERAATRLEVVKTALLANCIPILDDVSQVDATFTDLPPLPSNDEEADFAARVFYTARMHGIVSGFEDGSARPHERATLLETISILLRTANVIPSDYTPRAFSFSDLPFGDDWYTPYVSFVVHNNLLGPIGSAFQPNHPIRRDTLALLLAQTMKFSTNLHVRSYRDSVDGLVK
jgi:hypothetical protein